jgi:hypothetical protein
VNLWYNKNRNNWAILLYTFPIRTGLLFLPPTLGLITPFLTACLYNRDIYLSIYLSTNQPTNLPTPEPVWMTWRRENDSPYRDSNSDPSVIQPVASRYTYYAIPAALDGWLQWVPGIKLPDREGDDIFTLSAEMDSVYVIFKMLFRRKTSVSLLTFSGKRVLTQAQITAEAEATIDCHYFRIVFHNHCTILPRIRGCVTNSCGF